MVRAVDYGVGDPRFESRRETEKFFILSNRREDPQKRGLRKMMPRISSRPESVRDRKSEGISRKKEEWT